MSEAENEKVAQERTWPAKVAKVLEGNYSLILNRGVRHGVRMDQRFLVYELEDEDIIDPVTNKRLGKLETPKGTGKVVNVAPWWAEIRSDMFAETDRWWNFRADLEGRQPFSAPEEGDLAKPI